MTRGIHSACPHPGSWNTAAPCGVVRRAVADQSPRQSPRSLRALHPSKSRSRGARFRSSSRASVRTHGPRRRAMWKAAACHRAPCAGPTAHIRPIQQRAGARGGAPGLLLCQGAGVPCAPGRRPSLSPRSVRVRRSPRAPMSMLVQRCPHAPQAPYNRQLTGSAMRARDRRAAPRSRRSATRTSPAASPRSRCGRWQARPSGPRTPPR
jgi:hypothetical protein